MESGTGDEDSGTQQSGGGVGSRMKNGSRDCALAL